MGVMKIRIIDEPPLERKFRKHLREGTELEVLRVEDTPDGRHVQTKYWVNTPAGECALLEREIEVID
jgi:hypothetical protein